jgi:hypothetical protein
MKPFFHTQTNEVLEKEILAGITVGELKTKYQQPTWCGYPEALEGMMGCWSLMDVKGLRNQISKPFCRKCDCFTRKRKKQ